MKYFIITFLILSSATAATAQIENSRYWHYLESDLRLQREIIMTEAMQLTDAENTLFWPTYQDYLQRSDVLLDERLAVRAEYFNKADELDNDEAGELWTRYMKADEAYNKLLQTYVKRIERMVGAKNAAIFWQTETAIQLMLGFQQMQEAPLIR
jgi:hypothetical protein